MGWFARGASHRAALKLLQVLLGGGSSTPRAPSPLTLDVFCVCTSTFALVCGCMHVRTCACVGVGVCACAHMCVMLRFWGYRVGLVMPPLLCLLPVPSFLSLLGYALIRFVGDKDSFMMQPLQD